MSKLDEYYVMLGLFNASVTVVCLIQGNPAWWFPAIACGLTFAVASSGD